VPSCLEGTLFLCVLRGYHTSPLPRHTSTGTARYRVKKSTELDWTGAHAAHPRQIVGLDLLALSKWHWPFLRTIKPPSLSPSFITACSKVHGDPAAPLEQLLPVLHARFAELAILELRTSRRSYQTAPFRNPRTFEALSLFGRAWQGSLLRNMLAGSSSVLAGRGTPPSRAPTSVEEHKSMKRARR